MSSEEHGLESDMLFNDAVKRVRTKGWEPGEIVLSLAEKEKEGKLNLPQFVGPKWWEVQYWRPVIWVTETLFSTNWWASIWFRIKNGFWPVEAYNLDYHMAKWLLPRLKYLRKTSMSHPQGYTPEEWDVALDKIIWAFEFYLDEDSEYTSEREWSRFEEGIFLLVKEYKSLWD